MEFLNTFGPIKAHSKSFLKNSQNLKNGRKMRKSHSNAMEILRSSSNMDQTKNKDSSIVSDPKMKTKYFNQREFFKKSKMEQMKEKYSKQRKERHSNSQTILSKVYRNNSKSISRKNKSRESTKPKKMAKSQIILSGPKTDTLKSKLQKKLVKKLKESKPKLCSRSNRTLKSSRLTSRGKNGSKLLSNKFKPMYAQNYEKVKI